jgi:hypothetical protein
MLLLKKAHKKLKKDSLQMLSLTNKADPYRHKNVFSIAILSKRPTQNLRFRHPKASLYLQKAPKSSALMSQHIKKKWTKLSINGHQLKSSSFILPPRPNNSFKMIIRKSK